MEEEIYEQITKGVRKPKNKVGVFVCGPSGSGKSSNKKTYIEDVGLKTTYVYLNLDDVWNVTKSSDSISMFRNIVYKTIEDGYSFYHEGTCRFSQAILSRVKLSKENGYKLKLVLIYSDLDVNLKRLKERTEQPVKEELAKLAYSQVKNLAKEYMSLDLFDEIYLYNNTKTTKLIFYKDKKEIKCISPESKFYFDVSKYC
jgi:predicted ABC-type ATPase